MGRVVVMKNLNFSLNVKVLSPSVMLHYDPDFTTYCNNMGSKDGSRSLPTFSMSTHLPNYTASSRVLIKLVSFNLSTSIPSSCSLPRFLMYLLAYVYGSIMSG